MKDSDKWNAIKKTDVKNIMKVEMRELSINWEN